MAARDMPSTAVVCVTASALVHPRGNGNLCFCCCCCCCCCDKDDDEEDEDGGDEDNDTGIDEIAGDAVDAGDSGAGGRRSLSSPSTNSLGEGASPAGGKDMGIVRKSVTTS
jgi:hypothetical protein